MTTAQAIDPTAEVAYWRENFVTRPYVPVGATFEDYGPAYRYGVDRYIRYEGTTFEQAEPHLMRDWRGAKGQSRLTWEIAKSATRDSWQHASYAFERTVSNSPPP